MSKRSVKWSEALRYFKNKGYDIGFDGGDCLIKEPLTDGATKRKIHRVGHRFTGHTMQLSNGHLSAFKRKFDVTVNDILSN